MGTGIPFVEKYVLLTAVRLLFWLEPYMKELEEKGVKTITIEEIQNKITEIADGTF